jgi:hypothetical protein
VQRYRTVDGVRRDDLPPIRVGTRREPSTAQGIRHERIRTVTETLGWAPGCGCDPGVPVPCLVLDPFNGAGNTGLMAVASGCDYAGYDISPDYIAATEARLRHATDRRRRERVRTRIEHANGQIPLFLEPLGTLAARAA